MYEGLRTHIWGDEGTGRHGDDAPGAHLADLIDTTDPAFGAIAQALADFRAAGIELTEGTVGIAIKLGRRNHARYVPAAQPPPAPGQPNPVVYYIRRGSMVKIGTTINLRQRMAALLPDEVLATEPGSYELESARHRQFRRLRVAGQLEWFHAGQPLQAHVALIRARHGLPDPTLPILRSS